MYGNLLNPLVVSLAMSDEVDRDIDQLERIFGLMEEMATSTDEVCAWRCRGDHLLVLDRQADVLRTSQAVYGATNTRTLPNYRTVR